MKPHPHCAFTLVELSIVLVILGLLIGGILSGQSIVHAGQLRAVTSEYQRYSTAAQAFHTQYGGLPGDLSSATSTWGRLNNHADCASNTGNAVTSNGVCDGNDNGKVEEAPASNTVAEMFIFWRDLAAAGLIGNGTFSGISVINGHDSSTINSPSSKLTTAIWSAETFGSAYPANGFNFAGDYGNIFVLGAPAPGFTNSTAVLKPDDAKSIDAKMDDGMPGTGEILAINSGGFGSANGCDTAANGTDYTATYTLNTTVLACALFFLHAY